jgi:serine/threonine protein kinase
MNTASNDNMIVGKFKVGRKIGSGKFGIVYKGTTKSGDYVAIKIDTSGTGILRNEANTLNYLYSHGCKSIPFVKWYGIPRLKRNHADIDGGQPIMKAESSTNQETPPHIDNPCIVMSYFDVSLSRQIERGAGRCAGDARTMNASQGQPCGEYKCAYLKRVMYKVICVLEDIHTRYVIHRDVKPDNFMCKNGELFLIDFGLATTFVDETKKHKKYSRDNEFIVGTPKYASHHIHSGVEASRRDDLISAGYMYLHFLAGGLYWEDARLAEHMATKSAGCEDAADGIIEPEISILSVNCSKNAALAELKSFENMEACCKMMPESTGVLEYMKYAYSLWYDEAPNYQRLKDIFIPTVADL